MTDSAPYTTGTPHGNTLGYARFEYKRTSPDHTGGGYPRWRSTEWRPHTAAEGKEDVFVPVHRLCAIAWLFEDGVTAAEILQSEALVGVDVHHELGMPSANVGESPNWETSQLSLRDHGRHSEITQTQVRAWAADAKRRAAADGGTDTHDHSEDSGCSTAGCDGERFATTDSLDGAYCHDCIREKAGGETIDVL